ncbi:hypothetical protein Tco_0664094 [Tanacetum coccineum]
MDPNSSVGRICLGEDNQVSLNDEIESHGEWDSPKYHDTLEAYDGDINLEHDKNMISNEFPVKLCLEDKVKDGDKIVKKELIVTLRGEIYFVKFILNPEEDNIELGVILGRLFMRLTKGIAGFRIGIITIYPELNPFLDNSDESEKFEDDWDLILDNINFGDIPELEEPAKTNVKTEESDSDDDEDYCIKRNSMGAPIYRPNSSKYLNCNDLMDRALALQEVKEHGKLLVDLVLNGPFQYGTMVEPGNEATLATIRVRTYADLTDEEKNHESVDIKATNIVLQGLPQDIYNLVNRNEDAKQIWVRVKLLIQADFQTDDLDAFDSDCDDVPSAKAVLIANLSSYDSNVLLEVPSHDTNIENYMSYQSVQETQCSEQPSFDNDTEVDITSDNNIISYEQYLQETKTLVVQSTSSFAQQDALLMSVIKEMSSQVTKCNKVK